MKGGKDGASNLYLVPNDAPDTSRLTYHQTIKLMKEQLTFYYAILIILP